FIGTPLLVAAGAAIGGALDLELKPGWREGPNLYAGVVGDPGSKKTPAGQLALSPLQRIQASLNAAHAEQLAAYEAEMEAWAGGKRSDRGAKPTPPVYGHVLSTDATCEALAPML